MEVITHGFVVIRFQICIFDILNTAYFLILAKYYQL